MQCLRCLEKKEDTVEQWGERGKTNSMSWHLHHKHEIDENTPLPGQQQLNVVKKKMETPQEQFNRLAAKWCAYDMRYDRSPGLGREPMARFALPNGALRAPPALFPTARFARPPRLSAAVLTLRMPSPLVPPPVVQTEDHSERRGLSRDCTAVQLAAARWPAPDHSFEADA